MASRCERSIKVRASPRCAVTVPPRMCGGGSQGLRPGAGGWDRTGDLLFTRQLLYLLSYLGVVPLAVPRGAPVPSQTAVSSSASAAAAVVAAATRAARRSATIFLESRNLTRSGSTVGS